MFGRLVFVPRCCAACVVCCLFPGLFKLLCCCCLHETEIDENNGVCPLTYENCTNYNKVYKLMSGALFYKINDRTVWTGYDQGWNLVKSNILDCDGFEVLYDVLAEVLPKLN